MNRSEPVAVYVHVPFCPSKCGYCDFNSYAMSGEIVSRTVKAIETEIRRSPQKGRPAKTIFFGGGTPTFLSSEDLTRLLTAVHETHPPIEGCETTSEANPCTVDASKFGDMRSAGFNRISLGAQSFVKEELIRLGRFHDASDVGRAVHAARRADFHNINLDLMFALPGQSMKGWSQNLDLALALDPEHLSLYCLTIEDNTRFNKLHLRGMLDLPDEDTQIHMYDLAINKAESAGYHCYEISNFAKPGFECKHNLAYWHAEEYAGYGPGAVGCLAFHGVLTRYTNHKHPKGYCEKIENKEPLWCASETVDAKMHKMEQVMLGLRLDEGVPISLVDGEVPALVNMGWVEVHEGRLSLTPEGRHFCTEVAARLT